MKLLDFELVNLRTGETSYITVPEDMTIEDFTRELRCEMGLQYTVGTPYHLIIDNRNRMFMQDDSIAEHVDMLWEGGDDPDDPDKEGPIYQEESYYPESKYSLRDLFPEIGDNILYGQDYDKIGCKLEDIRDEDEEDEE